MSQKARVLVVDDDPEQRRNLARLIGAIGYETRTAADGRDALEQLSAWPADVVVTDMVMPNLDGPGLLRELRAQNNAPPAIALTAFGSLQKALATIKDMGAFWFLEKPVELDEISLLLERAAAQSQLRSRADLLERQLSHQGLLGDMVGRSPAMQQVFALVRQIAEHGASALVTGESGTGKELVARSIHKLGPRSGGPFIAVNCAALPETLIESELFGHEKGAFTGAVSSRPGCFELAHQGVLLLDEIGEMPIGTQAKLLRVLEDSRVRRLGGQKETAVDVQVIAATNRDPETAVEEKKLRMDLYYRLNIFQVHLPALRERREDVPLLVEALLPSLNEKYGCQVAGVSDEVLAGFEKHTWPGNVRELRNVLSRALIMAGSGLIELGHLPPQLNQPGKLAAAAPQTGENGVFLPVGTTVRDAERQLIEKTLEYTDNNKTRAAAILEIGLKTLHNKLKQYAQED